MSNKTYRYFVLTGAPGTGKTTLVKKLCQALKNRNVAVNGFLTEEIRTEGVRTGFDVILLNRGERARLARINSDGKAKGPFVGKYAVDVESFESCVLPLFNTYDEKSVLVLDEVGKMELLSWKFKEAVQNCIRSSGGIILATVPEKSVKSIPLVEFLKNHPDTMLITVNRENRNNLESEIMNSLVASNAI